MSIISTYQQIRLFAMSAMCVFLTTFIAASAQAQSGNEVTTLDPRLEELVQIVKSRAESQPTSNLSRPTKLSRDEIYLDLVGRLQTASFSRVPETILDAVVEFDKNYKPDGSIELGRITDLYRDYAQGLRDNVKSSELQEAVSDYSERGNWFEKFVALRQSAYLHGTDRELQAALQQAQLALSIIPQNSETDVYAKYAKSNITGSIAHLHNLQGNSSLALSTSLDYLKLTDSHPDLEDDIDLINNLIYAYRVGRDHEAQLFLSENLLDLEKTRSSSVPGLSEMRISGVMNDAARFDEALEFATKAQEKADNPIVIRNSQIYKAIALAGLGRAAEARQIARNADVSFAKENMLNTEESQGVLYLAYLLAQTEEPTYATQLFNRQLDVMAQKLISNSSRDTASMLAALENTRERQSERDAAAVRESELQAMTIKRQRNLNRALMGLSLLMGLAILAGCLFTRYRGRVLRKLKIKTEEAASAEKLKTDFLGMISHELRTPLNGIIGISDFLANYHDDDDIRKKTSIILRSGNELLSVVESLTDMARIDAGQLQLLPHDSDLGTSLATIPKPWQDKAVEKGLVFTAFIDPAIAQHHVDEDRIVQCINILLENAISFTDSGRVHLHITATKTEPMALTAIVADTGQGMSELVQSRLFTPFMQADASRKRTHMGTGLNLAIAYALAEMMDGSLSVVSREGRGSEFTFNVPLKPVVNKSTHGKLPLIDAESLETVHLQSASIVPSAPIAAEPNLYEPEPETQTHEIETHDIEILSDPILESSGAPQRDYVDLMQPTPLQGRSLHGAGEVAPADVKSPLQTSQRPLRILIVDDINSNRDILRLLLESKGHICREAADGFAALASLDHQAYDLVIMDIHMSPMDGVEAIRRIRTSGRRYENIPVIALTADNDPNINAESMLAGANLFLTKPVKREDLFRSIDYLRQSESLRILSRSA